MNSLTMKELQKANFKPKSKAMRKIEALKEELALEREIGK